MNVRRVRQARMTTSSDSEILLTGDEFRSASNPKYKTKSIKSYATRIL